MNWEKALRQLVNFINSQTVETDLELKRLRARETEIEEMSLEERLEYIEAVAEAKGKIDLLKGIKDFFNSLVAEHASSH